MEIDIRNTRLSLARHGLVALRDAGGTRLTAHSGTFWITQEGTAKDYVIDAGDSLLVRGGGLTVVSALQPGDIGVQAAKPDNVAVPCAQRLTVPQRWRCRLSRLQQLWAAGGVHAL